jgi:hypothetical protein
MVKRPLAAYFLLQKYFLEYIDRKMLSCDPSTSQGILGYLYVIFIHFILLNLELYK